MRQARLILALAGASGCVTVYQPLSSLQRPAIVDPTTSNFAGMRLALRCIPGQEADTGDSERLCENLKALYTNQGAQVTTEIVGEGRPEEEERPRAPKQGAVAAPRKPDLIIDLSSVRRVHEENSILLWVLSIASATLIPAITESTWAQDVSIRDADGFLLISDSLQARFVRYMGIGYLATNWLADLVVRPKEEALVGSRFKTEFSKDFHGQMSQLAFHARMRAAVLRNFEASTTQPEGKAGPP